ncbi:hypothetical protein Rsub_05256 [Raphidocelis subcapitata]|uniref:Uncharacterized protein n=1 Tax=Raphidocelis subcapitata TaxID=307507 RepID=A0A2V0NX13_9CHLO|nr:hypothetical protein Rsub_05256 [Raphidocelis subcapitata]|eukprot:GBF92174.1 hypothetical protein Rsub_05256 [Raphidocelis subcapitata]
MASKPAATAGAGSPDEGEVDVAGLLNQRDKIKTLMRRDPRFIGRLITQLDKHMHKMMAEKHERLEQIRADEEALATLDATVASHITPNLERLEVTIAEKTAQRAAIEAALAQQLSNCRDLGKEVSALVSRARHTSSKLRSKTASDRLQEARGFTSTVPTTQLIRGKPKGAAAAAAAAAATPQQRQQGQAANSRPAGEGLIGGDRPAAG